MSEFTRRHFLGAAAVAASSMAVSRAARGADRSTSDPGPTNPQVDAQNPTANLPPMSDAGGVPPFKYPFSLSSKRMQEGGWSRQVTARELAISKDMAGVDMRLTAGGVRELHWHTAGEWAFMLYGSARITAVDFDGKSFVSDVNEDDLWFFPSGVPHSIQGLQPDGAEFMLVFDDGHFSEYDTVLLTDFMAHTPREIVAKNFGVGEKSLENFPKKERFIFQAAVPGPLADDKRIAAGDLGATGSDFAFRTMQQPITKQTKGGEVRIVDSKTFKVSKISMAHVTVHPGGMRELHWHPNADEWQFYIKGSAKMMVFASGGSARTLDFQAGDVGYIQKTLPHYILNTGDTDLVFLEMFKSDTYQDLSLSEWLAHTPPELVMAHLDIDKTTYDTIPKNGAVVMPLS